MAAATARSRSFVVKDCLGRGGFGEVYRARMTQPGGLTTTVALKVLLPGLAGGSQPVERLRDEARLLAALEHPAILKVVDVAELEGRVTLIAEYVQGQDLDGCCAEPEPMGLRALVQAIGEVASALHAAWSTPAPESGEPLHLLHRDVKPSNIRVGRHGEVKLLDFGIARTDAMSRDARTATHMIVGSLPYMAPERFADPAPGPAADVYGLGCCLYQGLVGEVPFPGLDAPQAFGLAFDRDRYETRLREAIERLPAQPDAVRRLAADCLAHDPTARPTARELTERCEALAGLLRGPTLKAWARARTWPEEAATEGPLVGRTLTEHGDAPTAAATAAPPPPPSPTPAPAPARARPWTPWLAATGGLVVAGLVAVVGVIAIGAIAWYVVQGLPADTEPSEPEVVEAPIDVAEPAPAPEDVVDAPAPRPARPAPAVTPSPVEAAPEPAPGGSEPEPPAVATGTVVVTGSQRVELRGAPGTATPGVVPAGTWDVMADFGAGLQLAGTVEVAAGAVVTVRCNTLLASCTAEGS